MDVVEGIDALRAPLGPVFVRCRRLRRPSSAAMRTYSITSSPKPSGPRRSADGHHLRPPPRRGPDGEGRRPLLLDPDERLERLEAAGVTVTVVQHFDQALREDAVRRIRRADPGARPAQRLPDDTQCGRSGVRAPCGTPTTLDRARAARRVRLSSSSRHSTSMAGRVRSSTIREAVASGDLETAGAPSRSRCHRDRDGRRGRRWSDTARVSRCRWRFRPMATTTPDRSPAR
jgi:hypothetical protein